jgi:biotin-(acetyl-CoA carboxylase) ligase
MNIITVGDRVTVTPDYGGEFIATVVGFTENNRVLVRDKSGNVIDVASFQVSDEHIW